MDWSAALIVVGALAGWIVLVRFVLPRFGIRIG
jgi:hypothetical protein